MCFVQEVKHLRDQLKQAQLATVVEVQCEMASRVYDLIMGKCHCSTLHHSQPLEADGHTPLTLHWVTTLHCTTLSYYTYSHHR